MKIKRMYIENAYSFPVLDFDFTKHSGGVSVILGKNIDSKTNNGAGKSTILKSLFLLLYGKDLNGENIDDVISFITPQYGFAGFLEFEDKGSNFRITRYRKAVPREDGIKLHNGKPVKGNGIEFMMDDMCLNGESDPKTQANIQEKIKISPRLFLSSVLMSQNSTENFLNAADVKKKEILSELLDLMEYQKAFESIKKKIKAVNDNASFIDNKIESLNASIESLTARVSTLLSQESGWAETQKKEIDRLKEDKSSEEKLIKKLEKNLASIDNPEKIDELKKLIGDMKSWIKNQEKKLTAGQKLLLEQTKLESQIKSIEKEISLGEEKIEKNNQEKSSFKETEVEIVGLSVFEDEIEKIKKDMKPVKESSAVIGQKIINLSSSIENQEKEVKRLNKELKKTLKESHCPTCKKNFEDGDSHFEEIKKKFSIEIDEKKGELDKLKKALETLEKEKKAIEKKEEENKSLEKTLEKKEKAYQAKKIQNEKNQVILSQIEKEKAKLEKLKKENISISWENEQKQEKLKELHGKLEKYKSLLLNVEKIKDGIKTVEGKLKVKEDEYSQIEKTALLLEQSKKEIEERKGRVKTITETLDRKKNEENPYTKIKLGLGEDIASTKKELKEKKESIDKINEELKYLEFWKRGFAPTGIRSFISDDIIELLNMKTQANLNSLFDGALSVVFDPETTSKKGTASNKISTKFYLNGYETKKGLLSGGELQRCVLAVDLALTEIAESRAGVKLNLKFLDEPFNGIDANGQEKSLTLFSQLARKKDGFYIISHEEKFQNMCQNQVYILKRNGLSQFVDREAFDSINFDDEGMDNFIQKQEAAVKAKPKRKRRFKSLTSLDEE